MKERTILGFVVVFGVALIVNNVISNAHERDTLQKNRSAFMSSCQEAASSMSNNVVYCACARDKYEAYYGDKKYQTTKVDGYLKSQIADSCSY
jgi:hypothetical protein